MKYVIAALVACVLAGTLLALSDTLGGDVPVQVSPAPEAVVTESTALEPCPERNVAPRLQVSIKCDGLRCRFDASATEDDRGVSAWRWAFGPVQADEPVVTHEFSADGQYEVGVGAIDACGLADYRIMTIDVTAGALYACSDCLAAQSESSGASSFSRRNRPQGASPYTGRKSQRFSGGGSQPSPEANDIEAPQHTPSD